MLAAAVLFQDWRSSRRRRNIAGDLRICRDRALAGDISLVPDRIFRSHLKWKLVDRLTWLWQPIGRQGSQGRSELRSRFEFHIRHVRLNDWSVSEFPMRRACSAFSETQFQSSNVIQVHGVPIAEDHAHVILVGRENFANDSSVESEAFGNKRSEFFV